MFLKFFYSNYLCMYQWYDFLSGRLDLVFCFLFFFLKKCLVIRKGISFIFTYGKALSIYYKKYVLWQWWFLICEESYFLWFIILTDFKMVKIISLTSVLLFLYLVVQEGTPSPGLWWVWAQAIFSLVKCEL